MDASGFLVLTMRPGACSGGAALGCCQRPTRSYPRGSLSPSWTPLPPDLWRPPSSSFPPQGESCFPPPLRPRQRRSESRCLRTSCLKHPYGGDHLWSPWPSSPHLIGRRKQHLHRKQGFWVFRQRSRIVNPLHHLCQGLKKLMGRLRCLPRLCK